MIQYVVSLLTKAAAHAQVCARRRGTGPSITVRLMTVLLACISHVAHAAPPPPGCSGPEYRQFDFWLGDWDVLDFADRTKIVARVHVESVLDGCGLLESYSDPDGYEGRSFSIYDATRRVWHQTWLTNHGRLLVIEGQLRSGVMDLTGTDLADYGAHKRLVRGAWQPITEGVREVAARSVDDGKTWQPWFDLLFRRHVD
jgi:hypothetical protein